MSEECKRIELKTLKRICTYLYNNSEKRTKTAMYCNMAYDRFIPLITIMIKLGLVEQELKEGHVYLKLTDIGKRFRE